MYLETHHPCGPPSGHTNLKHIGALQVTPFCAKQLNCFPQIQYLPLDVALHQETCYLRLIEPRCPPDKLGGRGSRCAELPCSKTFEV